jgi:hypothetical protein
MRPKQIAAVLVLVVLGLLLVLGAGLLASDQPSVEVHAADRSRGPDGKVQCNIAPYDAGLNDNDSGPGGSDRTFEFTSEVADKCYAANLTRFRTAVGLGALGAVLVVGGAVIGAWSTGRWLSR